MSGAICTFNLQCPLEFLEITAITALRSCMAALMQAQTDVTCPCRCLKTSVCRTQQKQLQSKLHLKAFAPAEVNAVFVQQTMKTASSDEELAFPGSEWAVDSSVKS